MEERSALFYMPIAFHGRSLKLRIFVDDTQERDASPLFSPGGMHLEHCVHSCACQYKRHGQRRAVKVIKGLDCLVYKERLRPGGLGESYLCV